MTSRVGRGSARRFVLILGLVSAVGLTSCGASTKVSGQRNPAGSSSVSSVVVLVVQHGMWIGDTEELAGSLKDAFERRRVDCHAETVPDDHFDGSALPEAMKHADAVLSIVPIGLFYMDQRVTRSVYDVTLTSTPGKRQLWRGQAEAGASSFDSMSAHLSVVAEKIVKQLESDGLLPSREGPKSN
jgi:hypothetical protein